MRSGKLSEAITLQRAIASLNAAGTPTLTWSSLAELRAELVAASAAELVRAGGGVRDQAVVVFRTRFLAGVTTADRILHRGRPLNLKEVAVIGRNRGLELSAVAPEAS